MRNRALSIAMATTILLTIFDKLSIDALSDKDKSLSTDSDGTEKMLSLQATEQADVNSKVKRSMFLSLYEDLRYIKQSEKGTVTPSV
ncbi:hypothetical protein D918_03299 [Trichuris suis]|nr:hypothetical protein D918_03299 [Trichuris suis]